MMARVLALCALLGVAAARTAKEEDEDCQYCCKQFLAKGEDPRQCENMPDIGGRQRLPNCKCASYVDQCKPCCVEAVAAGKDGDETCRVLEACVCYTACGACAGSSGTSGGGTSGGGTSGGFSKCNLPAFTGKDPNTQCDMCCDCADNSDDCQKVITGDCSCPETAAGMGAGIIVLIIILVLCACGGAAGAAYYFLVLAPKKAASSEDYSSMGAPVGANA